MKSNQNQINKELLPELNDLAKYRSFLAKVHDFLIDYDIPAMLRGVIELLDEANQLTGKPTEL